MSLSYLVALLGLLSQKPPPEMGWLEGHWCAKDGNKTTEEIWTDFSGSTALGMHRDVEPGMRTQFEFMRIEYEDMELRFIAQPGGASPVKFIGFEVQPGVLQFENAAHDYPKRVGYSAPSKDVLEAWIDGGEGTERQQWRWTRC